MGATHFVKNSVGRQVFAAERDPDSEVATDSELAFHLDRAAVEGDEFVHKGQANATSLVGPTPGSFYPAEALEKVRDLFLRNAGASVTHGQLGVTILFAK
jgi:hypothetical protein